MKKRRFGTFTRDLKQLRAWLKNCKVTEIAMESTGQYGRPLWNLLEGEVGKLILVNPRHIKGLNGYKTDPQDAQWIADLLEGDNMRGSWVPPRPIRELRDLTRQRAHVLQDLNRVEQLCQSGNIKVSSVATHWFGTLVHPPCDAQADFGEALVAIGGVEQNAHFLCLDLPTPMTASWWPQQEFAENR